MINLQNKFNSLLRVIIRYVCILSGRRGSKKGESRMEILDPVPLFAALKTNALCSIV